MRHCSHIGLATTQLDSALAIVDSARRLVFADATEPDSE
jgi:hypothetical protein